MRTGFDFAAGLPPDGASAGRRCAIVTLVRAASAALLAACVASGCTVRVELASSRAVPGDLAATSSGLAPHRSLADDVVDERPQPAAQGLALATLLPADDSRGPVELLPAEGATPTRAAAAATTVGAGPVPALPPVRTMEGAARSPSAPRPALARAGEQTKKGDGGPAILPAAGPP